MSSKRTQKFRQQQAPRIPRHRSQYYFSPDALPTKDLEFFASAERNEPLLEFHHQQEEKTSLKSPQEPNSFLKNGDFAEPVSRVTSKDVMEIGKPAVPVDDEKIKSALVGLIHPNQLDSPRSPKKDADYGGAPRNRFRPQASPSFPLKNRREEQKPTFENSNENNEHKFLRWFEELSPPPQSPKLNPQLSEVQFKKSTNRREEQKPTFENSNEHSKFLKWSEELSPPQQPPKLNPQLSEVQLKKSTKAADEISKRNIINQSITTAADVGDFNQSKEIEKLDKLRKQMKDKTDGGTINNKSKTIFSMGPPMTQSKIVVGPGDNGDGRDLKVSSGSGQVDYNFNEIGVDEEESPVSEEDGEEEGQLIEDLEAEKDMNLKDEFACPCKAILNGDSSILLFPVDVYDSNPGPSSCSNYLAKVEGLFETSLEIKNTSPYLYAYKIRCNFFTLHNFNVLPRCGLVPPKQNASVTIQTKKKLKDNGFQDIEKGQFEINFFRPNCTDEKQLDNIFQQTLMKNPTAIKTQQIKNIECWDQENYVRSIESLVAPSDFSDSADSQRDDDISDRYLDSNRNKVSRDKKDKLDEIYTTKILPAVAFKRKAHSIRKRMLTSNQNLKENMKIVDSFQLTLHVFAFVCTYFAALIFILPFLTFDGKVLPAADNDDNGVDPNEMLSFYERAINSTLSFFFN